MRSISFGIFIGIDVSDKRSHVCIVDSGGEVVERTTVANSAIAFQRYFTRLQPSKVALEVGAHSPWMNRLLKSLGHCVFVANPRKVQLISKSISKNDKADAELLARLCRADPTLLSPIEHRSEQCQADLAVIRARNALVEARTALINHVRGAVKAMGGRLPKSSAEAFVKVAREAMPSALRPALSPLLTAINDLCKRVKVQDRKLIKISAARYPVVKHLQQIKGVGPITSLCFVLTLEDPTRFRKSRAVGAYLGLRPRQDESGGSSPELRITKAGDGLLRSYLVQAAHYVLGHFGPDSDLRRWGKKLEERGGKRAKKVAVVAVARKLATLLHRLWIGGEVYEPLRNASGKAAA